MKEQDKTDEELVEWEEEFRKRFIDIFYPQEYKRAEFKEKIIPADIILFFREVVETTKKKTLEETLEEIQLEEKP